MSARRAAPAPKRGERRSAKATLQNPDVPSFMRWRERGRGLDVWAVKPTGDWGVDCATGEEMALDFVMFWRTSERGSQCVAWLGDIGRAIGKKGDTSGVVCGFFTMLGMMMGSVAWHPNHIAAWKDRVRATRGKFTKRLATKRGAT